MNEMNFNNCYKMKISTDNIMSMGISDITEILNNTISKSEFESHNMSVVKGVMIEKVSTLFDDTIEISIPYYTNKEICILFSGVSLRFKVCVEKTDKKVKVSNLKRMYINKIGKFKPIGIFVQFDESLFRLSNNGDDFKVELDDGVGIGPEVNIKGKGNINELLSRDNILYNISKQNKDWINIRDKIILNASQPVLKRYSFIDIENEWSSVLKRVEEVNEKLIDDVIDNIFNINET